MNPEFSPQTPEQMKMPERVSSVLRSPENTLPPNDSLVLRAERHFKRAVAVGIASAVGVVGMSASSDAEALTTNQKIGIGAGAVLTYMVGNAAGRNAAMERERHNLDVLVSQAAKDSMLSMGFSYNEGAKTITNQVGQTLNLRDPRFADKDVMVDRATPSQLSLTYKSVGSNGQTFTRLTLVSRDERGSFHLQMSVPQNYPR